MVKAQILTAAGELVTWKQNELIPRGHSIECRVYAEDPYRGGMPSTGRLGAMMWPEGPGRRFEVGMEEGDEITPYYDPMVTKVIVWDESRPRAIRKMLQVLDEVVVFGVRLNIPYLKAILSHPEFVDGRMTTQFISTHFAEGLSAPPLTEMQTAFAKAAYHQAAVTGDLSAESAGGAINHGVVSSEAAVLRAPWMSPWRNA